jgi:hypothetical protein
VNRSIVFRGTTFGAPVIFPDGTVAAPSITFAGDTDHGFYRQGSAVLDMANNGNVMFRWNGAAFVLTSAGSLNWTSANADGTIDLRLTREGAAILQMGADVNGAAVAQTLKAHDGITGTDVAGANLTVAAGRGTGAGTSGNVILQAASALATGTTAQTLRDRQVIVGKAKALTAANATTFVTIGVASGGFAGGFIDYAIVASDGTDHQCRAGVLPFALVNKADTETGTVGTVGAATEVVAVSSGTLTNTFTIAAGTNAMSLQANAASSLTETNLDIYYQVHLNGPGTVTPA